MKKVFIAFGVILVASMARASYLYWQLDSTPENTDVTLYDNTGTPVTVYGLDVDASGEAQPTEYTGSLEAGQTYYIADNPSVNSYYLEYYNTETGNKTYTDTISRDTLVAYNEGLNVTTESLGDIDEVSPIWHTASGTMSPAPEPTSAMLMMFGMAFLGLKRKNRSIA